MICNYHTHTFRCHHAVGTEREYIERAIAGGIKKMGFSEHIPLDFPGDYRSYWRMDSADVENYIKTINALKEEYRGRIELFVGFEMEYYPLYFDEMIKNAKSWGAEYLILGEHYINSEFPDGLYCGFERGEAELLGSYVDDVVAGIHTGVYSLVAHPDIFNFKGELETYRKQVRRICEASVEKNVPLEINLLGIRSNRAYPTREFWRVAGETGCNAVLGFDAHSPADAYDAESIPKAEALAAEYGVKIIDDPKLIPLV
ncbi:MAG: histidinol-phosphatase [Clostridia bacterium]|nr:histidinol-phosphatase [Clostridia bacterium]